MTYEPETVRFLRQVCAGRGWRLEILDEHSAYLFAVSDGTASFLSGAGAVCAYPLNGATAATIAGDKAHVATLARRAGIRVPRGEVFFVSRRWRAVRSGGREISDAVRYASGLGFPVFVKPNAGSRGAYADMAYDEDDLLHQCAAMSAEHPVALVQEVVDGDEHRIVALDGEPVFHYRRGVGGPVGDGIASVSDLLRGYNERLVGDGLPPVDAGSEYVRRTLARAGLTRDGVPPPGLVLPLAARRNVSAGGAVSAFSADSGEALRHWVRRVCALTGLRVCGIDVITRGDLQDPAEHVLLEINANPSFAGVAAAGHEDAVVALWEAIAERALAERRA